jgi:hypothetical protein
VTIVSAPDSSLQRIAPGEIGPELEGWYREAPKVKETFVFWAIAPDGKVEYKETSEVVSVFGSNDGYIIKTKNSVYVIREYLSG